MSARVWRRVGAVACGWVALGLFCFGLVVLFPPSGIADNPTAMHVFAVAFGGFSLVAAAFGLCVGAFALWGRR